jgi:MFS family permease
VRRSGVSQDHAVLGPLRQVDFRRLWIAGTIGHLGTFFQLTAGPWMMLVLTGSPLMVSLTTSALFLPRILLTLPAGALADRMDRRRILVAGYLVSAVSGVGLAVATASGELTPLMLLVLTFSLGAGSAIAKPAQLTYVPDLVPPAQRAQAITLNSASHQVARIVGPSIGGAFIAFGRADAAFLANAASFLLVLAFVRRAPDVQAQESDAASDASIGGSLPTAGMLDGIRYLREDAFVRALIISTASFTLFAVGMQALLPNIVADGLGMGPQGFGVLYGFFGAGALAGAATRGRAAAVMRGRLIGLSMILYGLATVILVVVRIPVIAVGMLLLSGLAWVWSMTTLNSAVQVRSPAWVRGRVIAVFVLAVAMKPIGAALAGVAAEILGLVIGVALSGVGAVLVGMWSLRIRVDV